MDTKTIPNNAPMTAAIVFGYGVSFSSTVGTLLAAVIDSAVVIDSVVVIDLVPVKEEVNSMSRYFVSTKKYMMIDKYNVNNSMMIMIMSIL